MQGVEIGLAIASALAQSGSSMALRDLAQAVHMPPSKVHRYLVSLCRAGLVVQDGRNGLYDLGTGAVQLGLAALRRLDEFRLADETLEHLFSELGVTVGLSVWGDHGPTIIRRKEGVHHLPVSTRIGSSVSVIGTTSGRIFAAFLPRSQVVGFIDAEFAAGLPCLENGKPLTRARFEQLLKGLRERWVALSHGESGLGVDTASAPVFDLEGRILVVITLLAARGTIVGERSAPVLALQRAAAELSERLGYHVALQRAEGA